MDFHLAKKRKLHKAIRPTRLMSFGAGLLTALSVGDPEVLYILLPLTCVSYPLYVLNRFYK